MYTWYGCLICCLRVHWVEGVWGPANSWGHAAAAEASRQPAHAIHWRCKATRQQMLLTLSGHLSRFGSPGQDSCGSPFAYLDSAADINVQCLRHTALGGYRRQHSQVPTCSAAAIAALAASWLCWLWPGPGPPNECACPSGGVRGGGVGVGVGPRDPRPPLPPWLPARQ